RRSWWRPAARWSARARCWHGSPGISGTRSDEHRGHHALRARAVRRGRVDRPVVAGNAWLYFASRMLLFFSAVMIEGRAMLAPDPGALIRRLAVMLLLACAATLAFSFGAVSAGWA